MRRTSSSSEKEKDFNIEQEPCKHAICFYGKGGRYVSQNNSPIYGNLLYET